MLIVSCLLLIAPSALHAQNVCRLTEGRHFGGGYSANISSEWLGFCFFGVRSEGVGPYIDLKATVPMIYASDDFYDNISVGQAESWGDRVLDEKSNWLSVNVGLTRVISTREAFYVGVGYSLKSDYRKYYDEFHLLGTNGEYWVDVDDRGQINALAGLLLILGRNWGLQLGGELNPGGVTAGLFFID
jgi:hypothetical protein